MRKTILLLLVAVAGCGFPGILFRDCTQVRFIKTEIPLTFTGYEARYPVVSVRLQGNDYHLMLDTGSAGEGIALTREALAVLQVGFTGRRWVFRDAYGGSHESREFIIPSAELGDLELCNVFGNERRESVYGLDGVIGLKLLSRFDILIDYRGEKLTLYRRNHNPDFLSDEGWFKYEYVGDLSVSVGFGFLEGQHEIRLDTGCGCNLVSLNSDLGRVIQSRLREQPPDIMLCNMTNRQYLSRYIDHLYLEQYDLGRNHLVLGDLPDYLKNGLIGFDFFENNLVYINFKKREIWLKAVPGDNGTHTAWVRRTSGEPAEDRVPEVGSVSEEEAK